MPRAVTKRRKLRKQRKAQRRRKGASATRRGGRTNSASIHTAKRSTRGSTAIVKAQVVTPVVVEAGRRRELTNAEVSLIQNTVAKGTTPEQFSTFLWFCRKHEFDPLAKEVYCILFNVQKHHQDEKGIWCPGKEMVMVTGIGGLRGKAARDHREEYDSTDPPEYTFSGQKTPAGKLIPDTCTVSVWKRGAVRPTAATLYWEEFAPRDLTDSRFEFWNKSPKNQLAKCAEAQALRKAYPDLTNIYVTEEVARRMSEETPGGRRIIDAPSAEYHDQQIATEVERQKAGALPSPGNAIGGDLSNRAADKPPTASEPGSSGKPQQVGQRQAVKEDEYRGTVTVDFANEMWPLITGDLAEILPNLRSACPTMDWGKDSFWHIQPRDLENLKQVVAQLGYRLQEILPKADTPSGGPTPASRGPRADGPSTRKPQRPGGVPVSQASGAPAAELLKCRIDRSIAGMVGTKPVRDVTVVTDDKKKPTYRCFDKKYFEAFDKGIGQEALLVLRRNKGFTNIERPIRIGSREWEPDGTPVKQNREVGGKTLF